MNAALCFDDVLLRCWRGEREIHLSVNQWRLVNVLRFAPGPVPPDDLAALVVGADATRNDISVLVRNTRRKIEIDPRYPRCIRVVRRVGYVWECDQ